MTAINSAVTLAVDEQLFTPAQVAIRYRITPHSLANMRCAHKGPRAVKLPNGLVRYRLCDLEAWERKGRYVGEAPEAVAEAA